MFLEPIAPLAKATAASHSSARMSDRQLILDELLLLGTVKQRLAKVESMENSVKEGLAQSERGEGIPHQQVRKLISEWVKNSPIRRTDRKTSSK